MKLITALTPLLFSSLVVSRSLSLFGDSPTTYDESLKIPGDNPLEYCQASHESDLVTIDHVNLTPNPPKAYVSACCAS